MYDLHEMKDNECVVIGSKSSDFLGNPILNEYLIKRTDKCFDIVFSKQGERNQKYEGSVTVEKIISKLNSSDRSPELINYICENSNIYAETIDDGLKFRLKNVIYYKVKELEGVNEGKN